ncbi:hypothetical protein ISCGN_009360 [Ixodes scapularis]
MPNLKFPRDPRQCSDVKFSGLLRVDFLSDLRSTLQSRAPLPPRPEARRRRGAGEKGADGPGKNRFLRPVPRPTNHHLLKRRQVFQGRKQIQEAT